MISISHSARLILKTLSSYWSS